MSEAEDRCGAQLYIADSYGDNHAAMKCQKAPGHDGEHREEFERNGKPVVVTWWVDEREMCGVCEKLQAPGVTYSDKDHDRICRGCRENATSACCGAEVDEGYDLCSCEDGPTQDFDPDDPDDWDICRGCKQYVGFKLVCMKCREIASITPGGADVSA